MTYALIRDLNVLNVEREKTSNISDEISNSDDETNLDRNLKSTTSDRWSLQERWRETENGYEETGLSE